MKNMQIENTPLVYSTSRSPEFSGTVEKQDKERNHLKNSHTQNTSSGIEILIKQVTLKY